ncbi:serine/arginine-rich splicing factor 11-like isoform X4 [Epinephelus moara]|uniref:serine/arginine-rich splicing factor 11-like isoform X1 n=1 Tax=Epinephelus moara TaxID=300413 RepID=UPI00214E86AE|nr:serine/arginine-rich splicing factor 11-like isoform X1 [Epinephelus moara]XP_049888329.1 serine/arginine-rich splicing factor 11-like isoform X2 [Epinephelus moara]XP_049888330.1 serine/arginine-rich splicing factor 11-like isoform X3 [Epinephelus moara]XP_049888331.1 serine/arginine-rich splicing factor 11-like isoform X4 [Epinephelus moara]
MNYTTKVVQVTNVSPSTTSEQMRTLFGFLGTIEELKLFPPDDSPMPVTSRVCFVKFQEPESVGVSQHLTNTVFVDRALIVVPFAEGSIPDEAKALSLLAPANAVAGILPGGGLLPTPNPMPNPSMGGNPFGAPNMDAMAAFGFPGANMNPQAADQLLKFMTDPKLNPLAAGLNLSASLKADASNKEIEEAMKRVREAQSLISAAIEPGNKESRKRHSRSRSRSRRRRSRSRSRHRRSRSRSRRRSNSRSRRRSKSPRRKHTESRDRGRRSPSRSRDRKKEDSGRRRSRTPPKSYSTARRSRSEERRRRRSRSNSRSPKKSPKRRTSRSPSPRRHKKEKKRDKERDRDRKSDKDRSREERERSTSRKKKSKDKERERERKSDGEKGDVKITRDYDEEEQGYDSEKEREDRKDSDDSALSPQSVEGNSTARLVKQAKVNGADDHHEEDMDVSD